MKVEIKVPSPGESITEVQIARWIKKDGDYVERDEEIAEIDSDKATLSLVAEADGVLKTLIGEGENIAVGSIVCIIDTDAKPVTNAKVSKEEKPKEDKPKEVKPAVAAKSEGYASGTPSVAAAKMMKENNLKSENVQATGRGGRITKGDVLQTLQTPAAVQTVPQSREQRREKMTMLRKKLSQRLVAVKQETAMLTTFNEVDMSAIMNIRKQYKDGFKEKHGVGLGFMSFLQKLFVRH